MTPGLWRTWRGIFLQSIRIAGLTGILWLGLASDAITGEIVRVAHPFPPGSNFDRWVIDVVESAGKNTDISFKVFPGGELGTDVDLLASIKIGAVDMVLLPADVVGYAIPEFRVLSLPGLFSRPDHRERVVQQGILMRKLTNEAREVGLVPLSMGWTSWNIVSKDHSIRTVADLKGLRVRTLGKANQDWVRTVGAKTVDIRFNEVIPAMVVGEIDSAFTTRSGWKQLGKLGVINNISWSPDYSLHAIGYVLIMNARAWDRLTPEQRKAILAAGLKAGENFRRRERTMDRKMIKSLKVMGIQVTEISGSAGYDWQKIAGEASWNNFKSSVKGGDDLLKIATEK